MKVTDETGTSLLLCNQVGPYSPGSKILDENFIQSLQGYSEIDIQAVRSSTPIRGMSTHVLYMMWGSESQDNDYGQGGHQLVYDTSSMETIIYASEEGIVTEIQRFPK